MPKIKRARKAQAAAPRKAVKKTKPAAEISAEEVPVLEVEAARQRSSEQTWLSMTAPPQSKEEDHWSGVEEHMLMKGTENQDSERRWKYFSK